MRPRVVGHTLSVAKKKEIEEFLKSLSYKDFLNAQGDFSASELPPLVRNRIRVLEREYQRSDERRARDEQVFKAAKERRAEEMRAALFVLGDLKDFLKVGDWVSTSFSSGVMYQVMAIKPDHQSLELEDPNGEKYTIIVPGIGLRNGNPILEGRHLPTPLRHFGSYFQPMTYIKHVLSRQDMKMLTPEEFCKECIAEGQGVSA